MLDFIFHPAHYGILLISLGLFLRYQIGKRRFNRRSVTGVQLFKSYFVGLAITALESVINMLGLVIIVTLIVRW